MEGLVPAPRPKATRRPRAAARDQAAFTLVELLIVMVILSVATAYSFAVLNAQHRAFTSNESGLEAQERARGVIDLVAHDARMAGFMVPREAGISSVDGGNANPDRLCVSDPDYFSTPLDGTPEPTMDNMGRHFQGAAVTALSATAITAPVTDLDIDGDGTADFLAASAPGAGDGGGIILADGSRTHCAQIDQIIGGGTVTLVPAHAVPGGLFPVLGSVVAVPAIVYEVAPNSATLMRNGVVLSPSIEDLQVEYWVDSQFPDGAVNGSEFPVYDLNVPPPGLIVDLSMIRRVRISVVSRSERPAQQEGNAFARGGRPAVANRAAGAPDSLTRRRFTVAVLPRNLL